MSGALPLEVLEGPVEDGNSYEILVGLVWSPRLELAARAVAGGYAPTRADEAGRRIADWLPREEDSLSASWGVHKMIDENGDQVFVGFGQAAPRKTSASRRGRAEEAALRRAELRARGAIRGFLGEVVRSERSEEGEEDRHRVCRCGDQRSTRQHVSRKAGIECGGIDDHGTHGGRSMGPPAFGR